VIPPFLSGKWIRESRIGDECTGPGLMERFASQRPDSIIAIAHFLSSPWKDHKETKNGCCAIEDTGFYHLVFPTLDKRGKNRVQYKGCNDVSEFLPNGAFV
jgi:hypothetical protein